MLQQHCRGGGLLTPGPSCAALQCRWHRQAAGRLASTPVPRQQLRRPQRRALRAVAQALDPDNASILVAGGGGVALIATRRLKDMGSWVWVLQRSDTRRAEIEKMMAIVVRGDALNEEDVRKAFDQIEEVDAVVSTIGGTPADPTADSQGNINLIDAAVAKGVKKFVLVTSIGTGNSRGAPPSQVYEVLKPVLVEKEKAEEHLKATSGGMQWTIIRPGGLKKTEAPTRTEARFLRSEV